MTTKEEILHENFNYGFTGMEQDAIFKSMDDWARVRSIEFANWKDTRGYIPRQNPNSTTPQWGWMRQENQIIWSKWVSDDELYDLFIESAK